MKAQKFFPLVVVVAGLLAYQNSFTGTYLHDDIRWILENQTIRQLWPPSRWLSPANSAGVPVEGRPLINLSLAINYALGGYNVWGYHALNLTVHILAGLTLLGIVRRTLLQPALRERFGAAANQLALAIAVLWTIHPLQTESVTYIIQRAESMMGLFYLVTLYCFIRGAGQRLPASTAGEDPLPAKSPRDKPRASLWYGLSVTACALGMASKEVMITAPAMVLLYDRAFLSGSFREAWRQRRTLYLVLASTWILLAYLLALTLRSAVTVEERMGLSWWKYLATQPGVILSYLRLSVWPSPLTLYHNYPIARTWKDILPPAVVIVILLAASIWAWRRNPARGFVAAWFFLILSPSSSFIPLPDTMYEHRMYLSLAAVVVVVVVGLYRLMGRHCWAPVAAAMIGLGVLTWRQNQIYRRNPQFSLGFALLNAGRIEEGIEHLERAVQETPGDAWAHYDLASTLEDLGRVPEAIAHYQQALQLEPNFAAAHNNLGRILAKRGDVQEAIQHYEQALRINPRYAQVHCNLGDVLAQIGRTEDAIRQYEQALRINPRYIDAHNNLGVALAKSGRLPDAVEQWQQVLRIDPNCLEAHYDMGVVLEQTGRREEAIKHYEQVLRLKPHDAEVEQRLMRLRLAR